MTRRRPAGPDDSISAARRSASWWPTTARRSSKPCSRIRGGKSGAQALTALIDERAAIVAAFELVNLARACGHPCDEVAKAHSGTWSADRSGLARRAVNRLAAGNRWQARARAQLTTEVALAAASCAAGSRAACRRLPRRRPVLDELKSNEPQDLAMLRPVWPRSSVSRLLKLAQRAGLVEPAMRLCPA
jgi:hypothetical protein